MFVCGLKECLEMIWRSDKAYCRGYMLQAFFRHTFIPKGNRHVWFWRYDVSRDACFLPLRKSYYSSTCCSRRGTRRLFAEQSTFFIGASTQRINEIIQKSPEGLLRYAKYFRGRITQHPDNTYLRYGAQHSGLTTL